MTTLSALEVLRHANAHLGQFFARFSGAPVLGTNEEVGAMLQIERTLKSVGALLDQHSQQSADPEIREEFAKYRANLVRLLRELSAMQDSAASCRARLFARQKHLQAARASCAASRTLE